MSICASLDSAVTASGRVGLPRCGFHNKMINDVLSYKRRRILSSLKQCIKINRLFLTHEIAQISTFCEIMTKKISDILCNNF